MRPRTRSPDLPRYVHERRGAFYYVRFGRWRPLGRDKAAALKVASENPVPAGLEAIAKYALLQLARARANAKGRRKDFALERVDVLEMLEVCNWRCAVTNTPFSLDRINGCLPYAPSIDRRDCSVGYTAQNCRLVCVAANFAMNRWGEGVLRHIAENMVNIGHR